MTKQMDCFRIFCRLAKAFGTTQSRDQLLELIVESAIETMDGKAACLFLADEDQDVFVPVAQKGLSPHYFHASPMKARAIVAALVKKGHLAFEDATADPRLENHEAKKAEGIASILTVPVMVKARPIGVLSLYTAQRRRFSEMDIEFLSALADQGGVAVEQATLLERIRANTRLFLTLSSGINESLDIRKIMHILTAEISEALSMKGAAVQLKDPRSGRLETVGSYGLDENVLAAMVKDKAAAQALAGQTVIRPDLADDKRSAFGAATAGAGLRAMLCVPIRAKESVIGLMRVFAGKPHDWDEDQVALVQALAQTGGLAMENAACVLRLQDDMHNLQQDIWSHRSWF